VVNVFHFAIPRQMMKIIHQDAVPSAVAASLDMVAINAALCGVHACSFVPKVLNSLFGSSFSCPRVSNPMNSRHLRARAVGRFIKFPVFFPVSREFAP
jgi:hypothetical protein